MSCSPLQSSSGESNIKSRDACIIMSMVSGKRRRDGLGRNATIIGSADQRTTSEFDILAHTRPLNHAWPSIRHQYCRSGATCRSLLPEWDPHRFSSQQPRRTRRCTVPTVVTHKRTIGHWTDDLRLSGFSLESIVIHSLFFDLVGLPHVLPTLA
jgi:hypothetical protein